MLHFLKKGILGFEFLWDPGSCGEVLYTNLSFRCRIDCCDTLFFVVQSTVKTRMHGAELNTLLVAGAKSNLKRFEVGNSAK